MQALLQLLPEGSAEHEHDGHKTHKHKPHRKKSHQSPREKEQVALWSLHALHQS